MSYAFHQGLKLRLAGATLISDHSAPTSLSSIYILGSLNGSSAFLFFHKLFFVPEGPLGRHSACENHVPQGQGEALGLRSFRERCSCRPSASSARGRARRSAEEPGGARRSPEEPGGARRSPKEPERPGRAENRGGQWPGPPRPLAGDLRGLAARLPLRRRPCRRATAGVGGHGGGCQASGPGWGCARPASPRALPARSSAAPGGQNGGVEQPSAARGAGGPARPAAARGTDAARSRREASPWAGPGALTILRFAPPGRSCGHFAAGSGPGPPAAVGTRPGACGVGLRRERGCSCLTSRLRLKTTGTSHGSWNTLMLGQMGRDSQALSMPSSDLHAGLDPTALGRNQELDAEPTEPPGHPHLGIPLNAYFITLLQPLYLNCTF
ncbi:translation initiation factor IF-2-like [Panthera uncia]|uniref:translation initiation factor IF-2-like n=1 Tax=Panthera uncia TaxID=29064 RepID=UPI0020FF85A4|nr:translation initiation factor IF-2-like [Panthera uncia]